MQLSLGYIYVEIDELEKSQNRRLICYSPESGKTQFQYIQVPVILLSQE